jgi:hypothetical protein
MMDTDKFEVCVLFGVGTDVRKDTHVEEREWFVQGVGQLCLKCSEVGFTDLGSKLKKLGIRN